MATFVSPERNLSRPGFFGPATSTLDWCEANYQFSYYIAELANSFSSLWHVVFAGYLILNASCENLPRVFTLSSITFALVGFGSFAFHATLLYESQMSDEIPMIIFVSTSVWITYDCRPGSKDVQTTPLVLLGLFNVLFTWSYYLYRNPVYHQIVFGSLMVFVAYRMVYLTRWSPYSTRIPSDKSLAARRLYIQGAIIWVFAFVIWNLDNIFCDTITGWKVALGWPTGFLLEGHSWWHFFTGLGTYYLCVPIQSKILCIQDDHRNFAVCHRNGLPFVKRVGKSKD
ncbi:alkaline phytoceramidase [Marasmius fiardii PR-910]|nr:alkaline phytoceramidase [Marasmius fiardii PR-910]